MTEKSNPYADQYHTVRMNHATVQALMEDYPHFDNPGSAAYCMLSCWTDSRRQAKEKAEQDRVGNAKLIESLTLRVTSLEKKLADRDSEVTNASD